MDGYLVCALRLEVPNDRNVRRYRAALEELSKSFDESNFPDSKSFAGKVKVFYSHKEKLQGK